MRLISNSTFAACAITIASLTSLVSPSSAAAIDVTIGNQWKQQCTGHGRYTCCKQKEKQCIADGVGGTTCGSRYKQCVKKFRPEHVGTRTEAPANAGNAVTGKSHQAIVVRPKQTGTKVFH